MNDEKKYYKYSPITGEKLGPYKNTSREEVDYMIKKAKNEQIKWKNLPIKKRLVFIKRIIKVITDNLEEYAEMIHKDNGKSMIEAITTDLSPVLSYLEYYVKNAEKILKNKKVKTPLYLIGKKGVKSYEPLGIAGVIAPWNYPFQLGFIPAISAVIAGNAVILKPSSKSPEAGKIAEDIIKKSCLPENILNIAPGRGATGQYVAEGNIQKLFFTGSTKVGIKLAELCAKRLIPIELELGGSDPCIVLENADLERAANGAVWGSVINSGQTCTGVERIYVTQKDHDKFVEYCKKAISEISMGNDIDDDIGAMTTEDQIETVKNQLKDAVDKGAKIVMGGNTKDSFFEPTLIVNCDHSMDLVNEETFGPVVTVIKTKNDEESIRLANTSKYGLTSSIYGNTKKAKSLASLIEAGSVNINNSELSFVMPALPFGGIKESGIGRYHGEEGLYTFCNIKSVVIDRLSFLKKDFYWFPYGKNGFKNYSRFIKKYWGTRSPFKMLWSLPIIFRKKK